MFGTTGSMGTLTSHAGLIFRDLSDLELSLAGNFSRSKVHYLELEVCCDWSTFFAARVNRR